MNDGANRTIHGAVFTGSGGGANPGTNNYTTTGLTGGFGGFGSGVSGSTGGLMSGYADNYLNFSNAHIGGMDNLVVAQIIPEPGTAALAGLTALGLLRRRRK